MAAQGVTSCPQNSPKDELDELIEFLGDQRPQVAQHAAELVQGLTGSPEGIAQLSGRAAALLPPLLRLVGGRAAAARAALSSLVNLAQEPRVQAALLEAGAVGRCMDYLRERGCAHPHLLVMLLANLTAAEAGAAALLQLGRGPAEGLWMSSLLKLFLTPLAAARGLAFADPAAAATDPDAEDPFGHVATILPNVTRLAAGRRLLLQPGRGLLAALASQLRSGSERRRRGCAGAIKNCCFSAEEDGTVEHIAAEEQALAHMLDALCGVTGDKQADDGVREALAEAVLCLARAEAPRRALWAARAPELLGKGYEDEDNPTVCQCMEGAAELFLQDGFEPAAGEGAAGEGGAAAGAGGGRRDVRIEEVD